MNKEKREEGVVMI